MTTKLNRVNAAGENPQTTDERIGLINDAIDDLNTAETNIAAISASFEAGTASMASGAATVTAAHTLAAVPSAVIASPEVAVSNLFATATSAVITIGAASASDDRVFNFVVYA